jgi:hypothetical protein
MCVFVFLHRLLASTSCGQGKRPSTRRTDFAAFPSHRLTLLYMKIMSQHSCDARLSLVIVAGLL